MAGRVVSVEIGSLITKICEVDYKSKTQKVYNSFVINTPEGVYVDGDISVRDELVGAIKDALVANKVKSKQLVFTVASSKIANREVQIPFVKENRIADVVRANAPDYFPVDLSQYQVAYTIVGVEGDDKAGKKYRLSVLAAPNSILDGYYELAKRLKMEVVAIDYIGNSVYQIVKNLCPENTTNLVVKVDGTSTMVMAIKDKKIDFSRSLPYGVLEALDYVQESGEWGVAVDKVSAYELAHTYNILEDPAIKNGLSSFLGALNRIFEFYLSRGQDVNIDNVYLLGLGADFIGMEDFISDGLNRKVELVSNVISKDVEKNFKNEFFNIYLASVGAAVAPVNLKREDEKKAKKAATTSGGSKSSVDPVLIGGLVCGIGVVAAIGMFVVAFLRYTDLSSENARLNAQKSEKINVVEKYKEYAAVRTEYDAIMAVDKVTTSFNDELVAFFEELEKRLPSDVAVSAFSADSSVVTMTMKVSSKAEAAKVIEELRGFKTLIPESVTVTSLNIELDEITKMPVSVSFTVSASYNPNKDVEENEEAIN